WRATCQASRTPHIATSASMSHERRDTTPVAASSATPIPASATKPSPQNVSTRLTLRNLRLASHSMVKDTMATPTVVARVTISNRDTASGPNEQVLTDEPLGTTIECERFAARHQEQAPALQPDRRVVVSVGQSEDVARFCGVGVEVRQPCCGSARVVAAWD